MKVTSRQILEWTEEQFGVKHEDMIGRRKFEELTIPRAIAMRLITNECGITLNGLARIFGRSHTTILSNMKNLDALLAKRPQYGVGMVAIMERIADARVGKIWVDEVSNNSRGENHGN